MAKSKYANVVPGLPKLPAEDPSYQEQVDKLKSAITENTVHTAESLAKGYSLARFGTATLASLNSTFKETIIELLGEEGLEDLRKEAGKRVTAYEQLLEASYDSDDEGWGQYGASPNTLKLASGESVQVRVEPTGKVEDKEKFRLWCVANGLENSLQLWPSTMNSITKERLLAGQSAPDGVKAYVRSKIVWYKG